MVSSSSYNSIALIVLFVAVVATTNTEVAQAQRQTAQRQAQTALDTIVQVPGITGTGSQTQANAAADDNDIVERTILLELTGDDAICTLYQKETEFEDGSNEESWACQFTQEQTKKIEESIKEIYGPTSTISMNIAVDPMMDIIDGIDTDEMEMLGIVSGTAILKLADTTPGSILLIEHTGTFTFTYYMLLSLYMSLIIKACYYKIYSFFDFIIYNLIIFLFFNAIAKTWEIIGR